eukprot:3665904-Amphidinium_carterae.2
MNAVCTAERRDVPNQERTLDWTSGLDVGSTTSRRVQNLSLTDRAATDQYFSRFPQTCDLT